MEVETIKTAIVFSTSNMEDFGIDIFIHSKICFNSKSQKNPPSVSTIKIRTEVFLILLVSYYFICFLFKSYCYSVNCAILLFLYQLSAFSVFLFKNHTPNQFFLPIRDSQQKAKRNLNQGYN
jgi:hypothetical protein